MVPALLFFLRAPLFGANLLGNPLMTHLYLLPFLAPLYGGGAMLIREVTRRAGPGRIPRVRTPNGVIHAPYA